MKSIVKISVCIAFMAQLSNAQNCEYDGFKDLWDNRPETCYGLYNPWPDTETGGMCKSDVGLGSRGCIRQAADVCVDFVSTSCFDDCKFFHFKCCCSPLYPTIAPVAAVVASPTSSAPTKAPVLVPTSGTPTKAPDSKSPTKSPVGTTKPTRVPTDAPTIPLSAFPSTIPSESIMPSVVSSDVPSSVSSIGPTSEFSSVPSLSVAPSPLITLSPTLSPSSRCPWDSFTGFEPDCVNYNKTIGGDYCYFSAEHQRNWDNSGKLVGDKNPFKLCTITAMMNCDLYEWYPYGAQCNSLCTNFHAICCCHPAA